MYGRQEVVKTPALGTEAESMWLVTFEDKAGMLKIFLVFLL